MLQAGSFQWRVALLLLVLLAIFLAGSIAVAVAGWWPLSGEEEEVLWGYVESDKPVQILA